jgi:hypothetical protein
LTNEEFARDGAGILEAVMPGPADRRMDLFTVVLHEMGHLARFGDVNNLGHPDYLMDRTLEPGIRRDDDLEAIIGG